MGSGAFIVNNIAPKYNSIWTNVTFETGKEKEFLFNDIPSLVAKTTSSTFRVSVNFSVSKTISAIAIINHNIPSGSDIYLKFSNDEFVTTSLVMNLSSSWNIGNMYALFSPQTYKNFKLAIMGNSGTIQIGEFVIGTKFIPSSNYLWGFKPIFKVNKDVVEINGQFYEEQISEQSGFSLNFKNIDKDDYEQFKNLFRSGHKIFIPDTEKKDCFHGHIVGNLYTPERFLSGDRFPLEFLENSIVENGQ